MFKGAASRCTSVLLCILWGFDISTFSGCYPIVGYTSCMF